MLTAFDPPLTGTPESEAAAFTLVKHMKTHYLGGHSYEELSDFRQIIRKILLENSRNVVRTLQLNFEHLNHTMKVRCFHFLYPFSINMSILAGQLRIHYEPPNRHPQP